MPSPATMRVSWSASHVQLAAPGAHFLKIGFELLQQRVLGRVAITGMLLSPARAVRF